VLLRADNFFKIDNSLNDFMIIFNERFKSARILNSSIQSTELQYMKGIYE